MDTLELMKKCNQIEISIDEMPKKIIDLIYRDFVE